MQPVGDDDDAAVGKNCRRVVKAASQVEERGGKIVRRSLLLSLFALFFALSRLYLFPLGPSPSMANYRSAVGTPCRFEGEGKGSRGSRCLLLLYFPYLLSATHQSAVAAAAAAVSNVMSLRREALIASRYCLSHFPLPVRLFVVA